MRPDGSWDIRVTPTLRAWFCSREVSRKTHSWRISAAEAAELIQHVCAAYDVPLLPTHEAGSPAARAALRKYNAHGLCRWHKPTNTCTIHTTRTPPLRILLHELYHHIDFWWRYAQGAPRYDSNDDAGYADEFADRLLTALKVTPTAYPEAAE
jgi:hypothetical protein